jgi:membrane protein implicated in regulation of membrane protease activity
MTAGTLWWVITGVLVAAELVTGTFFLLMLALGAAAGALAAMAGWAHELQITAAALVGGCAVALWYVRTRQRHAAAGHTPLAAHRDPDVTLDLGQTVQVTHWADDHSTQVQYRGALWTARAQASVPTPLTPGPYRIAAMQGNVLLLDKV